MSGLYELNADNLKKIWNNTYGGRVNPENMREAYLAIATQDGLDHGPDVFVREKLNVEVLLDGKPVTEPVECCFARFGNGADAQWVVFQWYKDGWASAVRPFTSDTENMPWLLEYIERRFGA